MNHILNLIEREQQKLKRRRELVEETQIEIDVFGESVKLVNKLNRQKEAVKESESNLKKLNAANK
jgi:hypothetical protein